MFKIAENLLQWPPYSGSGKVRRFLLHRFPYAVVYRHKENLIEIVAFMHLKRKPGYWNSRMA